MTLAVGTLAALTGCDGPRSDDAGVVGSVSPSARTTGVERPLRRLAAPPSPPVLVAPVPSPDPATSPVGVAGNPAAEGLYVPQGGAPELGEGIGAGPRSLPQYSVTLGDPPRLIDSLPGSSRNVALTIDDGVDSAVVKAYLDFIQSANLRLTFFVNGVRRSWTDNAAQLRPLVDSGQVQMGNHTWSHPDLTKLAASDVVNELRRNEAFLANVYGVTARPFFRPPYGARNRLVDQVAADQGLSTITMWDGSFGDATLITSTQLIAFARQWIGERRIVIGHANWPTVTGLYPQILEIIRERALSTMTLDDAFYGARGRDKTPQPNRDTLVASSTPSPLASAFGSGHPRHL